MAPGDRPLVWLRTEVKSPPFSASARLEAGFILIEIVVSALLIVIVASGWLRER